MGGRTLPFSGRRVLDQKIGRGFTHKTTAIMVNRPPPSFINGRPPFRAATAPRRNLSRRRTRRTRLVAARRSWAARGLSSGRFAVGHRVFTLYLGRIWKYPFNQPDECFRGSVEPHMHRISLGIGHARAEMRRSGRTVESVVI